MFDCLPNEVLFYLISFAKSSKCIMGLVNKNTYIRLKTIITKVDKIAALEILSRYGYKLKQPDVTPFEYVKLNYKVPPNSATFIGKEDIVDLINCNLFQWIPSKNFYSIDALVEFGKQCIKLKSKSAVDYAQRLGIYFGEFNKLKIQECWNDTINESLISHWYYAGLYFGYAPLDYIVKNWKSGSWSDLIFRYLGGRQCLFGILKERCPIEFEPPVHELFSFPKIKCDLKQASLIPAINLRYFCYEPSWEDFCLFANRSKTVAFIPRNPKILNYMNENNMTFDNVYSQNQIFTSLNDFLIFLKTIKHYNNVFKSLKNLKQQNYILDLKHPNIISSTQFNDINKLASQYKLHIYLKFDDSVQQQLNLEILQSITSYSGYRFDDNVNLFEKIFISFPLSKVVENNIQNCFTKSPLITFESYWTSLKTEFNQEDEACCEMLIELFWSSLPDTKSVLMFFSSITDPKQFVSEFGPKLGLMAKRENMKIPDGFVQNVHVKNIREFIVDYYYSWSIQHQ